MSSTSNNSAGSISGKPRLNTSRGAGQAPTDQKPQREAWTGQPLSQTFLAAATQSNGEANGRSNGVSATTGNSAKKSGSRKQAHDRLLFLLANFTGLDAIITLKNGDKYSGVFSGMAADQSRYILKMTRRLSQPDAAPLDGFLGQEDDHVMSFDIQDTIDLQVQNASLSTLVAKSARGAAGPSFKTDVEISGSSDMLKERELHRWQPGPDASMNLSMDSGGIGDWDQFAANEKLYNVRSDFDENLYTTAIDRTDPKYKQAEQRATRLAREIERDAASRSRGIEADSGLDEEDKYSGVIRNPPPQAKAGQEIYVPPSRRPAQSKPPGPRAPADPAIIFSQLARPAGPVTRAGAGAAAQNVSEKRIRDNAEPTMTGTVEATAELKSSAQPPSSKDDAHKSSGNASPARDAQAGTKKSENYYQDVYESFKQFTVQEKQRIQNHQKALAQQRTTNARQEKSVKLNDLRKFSQTFKLTSRVPEDLVPILAKSKEKQNEIRDKAEQQARDKQGSPEEPPLIGSGKKSPVNAPVVAGKENSASSATQNPAGLTKASLSAAGGKSSTPSPAVSGQLPAKTDSGLASPSFGMMAKLNVKAMEFKPNPGAASFAPTGHVASPAVRTSQMPSASSAPPAVAERTPAVFIFSKPAVPFEERGQSFDDVFNPLRLMLQETAADSQKKQQAIRNGGIPNAYRTAPTWDCPEANADRSYVDFFTSPQGRSPVPISRSHSGMVPHHQLPPHLQGGASSGQGSPRFASVQQQHYGQSGSEEQRMHYNQRQRGNAPQGAFMYGGQIPPQMQGYAYGMPPGSMGPGGHMRPMASGAQFMSPGPMSPVGVGGHMMVQQPSNGPMPPHFGMFPSPNASHAQPQMVPAQMGGYAGSPRAQAMSHQGSQQSHMGYNMAGPAGPMMMMSPQPGGQVGSMRGMSQTQIPGSYAMQHRAMSGQGNPNPSRQQ